jgi:erythronate-4-phosphate dehydrogenase
MEGKLNGTIQVYEAACRFFGLDAIWDPAPLLPAVEVPELTIDPRGKTENEVIAEAGAAVYDIRVDQLSAADIPNFDKLRAGYWVRREFKNTRVILTDPRPELSAKLIQAGFSDT